MKKYMCMVLCFVIILIPLLQQPTNKTYNTYYTIESEYTLCGKCVSLEIVYDTTYMGIMDVYDLTLDNSPDFYPLKFLVPE